MPNCSRGSYNRRGVTNFSTLISVGVHINVGVSQVRKIQFDGKKQLRDKTSPKVKQFKKQRFD